MRLLAPEGDELDRGLEADPALGDDPRDLGALLRARAEGGLAPAEAAELDLLLARQETLARQSDLDAARAAQVSQCADAVVVGSAIIKRVAENVADQARMTDDVSALLQSMRQAMDS